MNPMNSMRQLSDHVGTVQDLFQYLVDTAQRSVLYTDTMRKRGNIYFEHIRNGKPPVLKFDYEVILDGKDFKRPVNFTLAQVIDRRDPKQAYKTDGLEKRQNPSEAQMIDPLKRPIIIIDPRAGHGPGIGGSKRDSEIGMALNEGHPVYLILFSAIPEEHQTLTDVHQAQIRFIDEVAARHPKAPKPAIIGNCQAGWAAALIGADRPDISGPLVFNGSPLSYWAGVKGKNPMRYRGGLFGGVWLASLWSDLGNGKFDGANLVAGFEDLNPANTLWNKQYFVYANIDTEANRYLEFERWWNGYYMMTGEEIHYIVDNLFVGNKLEKGLLEMEKIKIDLKNLRQPVLVFASSGDNITPPQQALNWIPAVWGSVDEIKRRQQVIVYLLHDTIGHLGIFVSGKVSKKEHKEIIASVDLIEYLSPGLYEMVIEDGDALDTYKVRFAERDMEDILALDDGEQDEDSFSPVAAVSEFNDRLYRTFVSPWVRSTVTEETAEWIRQLHPLRVSRYMFSDANPWMLPFKFLAPLVKQNRKPVSPENPYMKMEKEISKTITDSLNLFRDMRDLTQEFWFNAFYDNPLMRSLVPEEPKITAEAADNTCRVEWLDAVEEGGFAEGVVRIMVAMAHVEEILSRQVLSTYNRIVAADKRLSNLSLDQFKRLIRQQACILSADKVKAIEALTKLIPDMADRKIALSIAEQIAVVDKLMSDQESSLMTLLRETLKIA